ncbi:MAG: hypothetical protein ACFFDP_08595 [Promethearchaeota archaeon]
MKKRNQVDGMILLLIGILLLILTALSYYGIILCVIPFASITYYPLVGLTLLVLSLLSIILGIKEIIQSAQE